MQNKTNHKSFVLKPSTVKGCGVGVFAVHDILKDTFMELFTKDFEEEACDEKDVPKELRGYCIEREDGKVDCPKHFNRMDIGNYLNHSNNANTCHKKGNGYKAVRDILAGEEIFANYRELGEPEEKWDDYYKN